MGKVEIGLKRVALYTLAAGRLSKIFWGYVLQLGNLCYTLFMMAMELTVNTCPVGGDFVFLFVANGVLYKSECKASVSFNTGC
jgi:hypothetical protein